MVCEPFGVAVRPGSRTRHSRRSDGLRMDWTRPKQRSSESESRHANAQTHAARLEARQRADARCPTLRRDSTHAQRPCKSNKAGRGRATTSRAKPQTRGQRMTLSAAPDAPVCLRATRPRRRGARRPDRWLMRDSNRVRRTYDRIGDRVESEYTTLFPTCRVPIGNR
ncbi:hypothetical protein EXIGLDRAFT_734788 [Exidia glandulosa HHB12029]|uniref:Uncharacterized protein n=1 Tax=Exidia glandulosa HHB12029 TaxID=1314781 RepID=A0A165K426_EXIGL|nr:hypothetical protein EXIGLDRAFT_734788 [Exidia glandulosa HHB12029]